MEILILSSITAHLRPRGRRSPLTRHSLRVESQTRCLLGIVRPRSAHGDTLSHNNYNRICTQGGSETSARCCTPDARHRYRCPNMVLAEKHVLVYPRALVDSSCLLTVPVHGASTLVCSDHSASIAVPIPPSSSQMPVLRRPHCQPSPLVKPLHDSLSRLPALFGSPSLQLISSIPFHEPSPASRVSTHLVSPLHGM